MNKKLHDFDHFIFMYTPVLEDYQDYIKDAIEELFKTYWPTNVNLKPEWIPSKEIDPEYIVKGLYDKKLVGDQFIEIIEEKVRNLMKLRGLKTEKNHAIFRAKAFLDLKAILVTIEESSHT